jgi:prolyl oligopeptidase
MRYLLPFALFILLFHPRAISQTQKIAYPFTPKEPISDNYFGTVVNDPYRWLENDTSTQTKEWVKQQNDFSEKYLKKLLNKYPFKNQLHFNSYIYFGSTRKEGKFFVDFIFTDESQGISSLYLKKTINESPDLAIDPADYKNKNSDIVRITGSNISKNNKYIAFGLSYNGSDWNEIHVKSLYPFKKLPDLLRWVKFSSIEWKGEGFFYSTYDSVNQSDILTAINENPKIFYHKIGTLQNEDQLIFRDSTMATSTIQFSVIDNERYLIINHHLLYNGKMYNKISYIDFKKDSPALTELILSRNYYKVIGAYNGKFLLSSNYPALNGSLSLISPDLPDQLEEFIPEHKEILKQTTIVGDKIICLYLNDIDYIAVTYNKTGEAVNKIVYPVGSSVEGFDGTPDDPQTIFFYHSFLHPPIAYMYDVNTLTVKLIQTTEVRYDLSDFEVRKVYYYSKDGSKIPMIIAGKKGFKLSGNNPTILYGYGGYGISLTPFFDKGFINHLQNGGLLALPSLRGGGEYGEKWHEQGKLLNKQNVFDDFIAAAEYLKNEHYTSKEKLAIMGGSNGGLLIGAILNQRPDLCQVAVAEMGIFDMLRYQKYTIGYAWENEFGTSGDSTQFKYIYRYSPLHNVTNMAYPATLIITADHDDRVVPMHSYKFAATLQEKNKGNFPVLLLTEKNYGHHGGNEKAEAAKYAFIYEHLGINPVSIPN